MFYEIPALYEINMSWRKRMPRKLVNKLDRFNWTAYENDQKLIIDNYYVHVKFIVTVL